MPHAVRDRQYLIISLYITDHGLRNFGNGRYVPRSPLANRQIPAEPRFQGGLRNPHLRPNLFGISVPPALGFQRSVAGAPFDEYQKQKTASAQSCAERSTAAASRYDFRHLGGTSERGDCHRSCRAILASG